MRRTGFKENGQRQKDNHAVFVASEGEDWVFLTWMFSVALTKSEVNDFRERTKLGRHNRYPLVSSSVTMAQGYLI